MDRWRLWTCVDDGSVASEWIDGDVLAGPGTHNWVPAAPNVEMCARNSHWCWCCAERPSSALVLGAQAEVAWSDVRLLPWITLGCCLGIRVGSGLEFSTFALRGIGHRA